MNKKALVFLITCLAGVVMLEAKITVSKIEYLPGEDFVQLFLRADRIMPIPDIFHPEKNKRQNLVMRMRDVDFALETTPLTFDSPVIQDVHIRDGNGYTDVEIRLKAEVDYRIFTNQNGLFIEFPMVKELARQKTAPAPVVPAAATPLPVSNAPLPAKTETQPVPAAPAQVIRPELSLAAVGAALNDVRLAAEQGDCVTFELLFNRVPEYQVIPIDQGALRLAIDLKATQSRKLRQEVNAGNVRMIRGAYNAPDVYRVVFDLTRLDHYAVTADGNRLLVSFFDKPPAAPQTAAVAPEKQAPAAAVSAGEPVRLAAAVVPAAVVGASEVLPTPTPIAPSALAAKKEFFSTEKSRSSFISTLDEKGNEQTSYVSQTINEGKPKYSGEPMDFSFKNAELVNVLKFIAKIAGLNLMIDPNVGGRITCELIQVPWDQALELFLKINKLAMVQEGNILRIGSMDALRDEAEKSQRLRVAKEQEGDLEVVTRALSFAKVAEIMPTLRKMMSARGELTPDARTNTLIIQEVPEKIKMIDRLIDTLDSANPQVSIEARIVETTVSNLDTFGIQWGYNMVADASTGNQTNLKFPANMLSGGYSGRGTGSAYAINLPAASSVVSPYFRFGNIANTFNIDVALSAMTQRGKARIISAPKTTTQNNMPAELTQGKKIPITTRGQDNAYSTAYVNAALELKVTPQITARGSVIMKVEVNNDMPNWDKISSQGNPEITTESAKTTVAVMDGGTIVIGGLYKISEGTTSSGVPILSKIPIIGSLFKNSRKSKDQAELLIFITPRIIK